MLLQRSGMTAVAIASAAVAACAMGPELELPGERSATTATGTTVVVENGSWADATVSAVRSGTNVRARLGLVMSMQTRRFEVPRRLLANGSAIRLEADPVGSDRTFVTGPIAVSAGDIIDLRLHEHVETSNWMIR